MKRTFIAGAAVFLVLALFTAVFPYVKGMYSTTYRSYQHEERRNSDPKLGMETVPEDGILEATQIGRASCRERV